MNRTNIIFIYIWLIVLTIIGIATLVRTFYHDVSLEVDYSGILVGILSALCTVLIGWQIYTIVDLKNINDKFNLLEKKRSNDNLNNMKQIYESMSTLTYQLATRASKEELLPQAIKFDILSILTYSKLGEYEVCEMEVKNMIQTTPNDLIVRKTDQDSYLKALSEMQGTDKIASYNDLIIWVSNLNIHPDVLPQD